MVEAVVLAKSDLQRIIIDKGFKDIEVILKPSWKAAKVSSNITSILDKLTEIRRKISPELEADISAFYNGKVIGLYNALLDKRSEIDYGGLTSEEIKKCNPIDIYYYVSPILELQIPIHQR